MLLVSDCPLWARLCTRYFICLSLTTHPINPTRKVSSHFPGGKTESQKGEIMCPRSPSEQVVVAEFEPWGDSEIRWKFSDPACSAGSWSWGSLGSRNGSQPESHCLWEPDNSCYHARPILSVVGRSPASILGCDQENGQIYRNSPWGINCSLLSTTNSDNYNAY